MSKIFINSISSISPQPDSIVENGGIKQYISNIIPSLDQDYKAYIKPMMLRRMSKAVRMALLCSKKIMEVADLEMPEAIIIGTGQGCMQDTENFIEQILQGEDKPLSPTSFIQSTHNTVGGQIALDLKCTGYNMTYTQNSVSFESALIDALMHLESGSENILVGGVEEIAKTSTRFEYLDAQLRQAETPNLELFNGSHPGTITSEAASFFLLSSLDTASTYAEIRDVHIINSVAEEKISSGIEQFLNRNELNASDIDIVILGNNGDSRYDYYYQDLQKTLFKYSLQLAYKHLVGDNNTISAYAVWLACKLFRNDSIPEIFKLNDKNYSTPKNILIYNQYLGRNHGLILLKRH